MSFPLAYHITWGTYGTRLHGDDRGTVDRAMNQYGDPIIGRNDQWECLETSLLRFPQRFLTGEQRLLIEEAFPSVCARGGWRPIQVAAAPDHVHSLLIAAVDGKSIRRWLKRWLGEALSARWPLNTDEVWWAECGSVKWVWTQAYFDRVVEYVGRQRTTVTDK